MKTKVTAYTRYVSLLLFVLGFLTLQSQPVSNIKPTSKTITGKVVDENNAGLSGVTIRSNEGNASVTTLADGSFSITTLATAKSLIVTYIGYADQQVNITGTVLDNIKVLPDSKAIESVVVVGYGTRKKTDVTAAIASVSGEKLRQVPTTNLTQALQGRITGVEAAASGFRPGSGSRIRIRGSRSLTAGNDPLYVVDGFPVTYTIDDMNPLDIESIDILKDASATAVYGVRGANGVVQITTKKAKAGKITLDYSGSQSYETHSNPTRMLNAAEITDSWRQAFYTDRQYNYTQSTASPNNYYPDARSDARMFLELGNQNQWNGIKDAYSWRVFDPVNKIYIANKRASTQQEKDVLKNLGLAVLDSLDIYDPSKLKNYDWANEGLRQGVTKSHNVTMSAGTDKIKTTFSGSYFNQKGIEYGQDYTRYSVGNSNEFKINKNIMFGSTVTYANTTQNTSTSSLGNALGMIPLAEAYDSAGNYILYPNGDRQIASAINDRNTVFDETKVNRLFGNIYGEITILKGLKFRTMFGLDTRNSSRGTFNGANSSVQQGALANASQTVSNSVSWVYDNILTYNTTIANDHSINVTALYELQKLNRASSLTMSAQNLIFEEQKWYSLNRNTLATVNGSGTFTEAQYLSYMGRLEYGYKNKYLLTVSNRYDNSSVLADGNKGAYFPSASVAWRLENEDFFTKQKLFTTAKIRLGIGRVGNASIDPYQTNGPLEFTGYNWGNGSAAIGLAPTTFRTPGLTREKTTTKNLGLDFGLLRNRVVGSIDMYSSSTIDMLQRKTIPAANGVQTVFVNIGEVSNKGFELSLTTQNIVSKNGLNWSTDFVFSKNKEKIVDIDGTSNSNFANLWLLGQPLQVYYNYKSAGIFQYSDTVKGGILADYYWPKVGRTNSAYRPGAIRIQDTNGDSIMNASDKVILGTHNANWTGSITNTIGYKNFELNFMVYFRVGGLYRFTRPGFVGRYQSIYANYWTPTNPSNEYQQPTRTTDVPVFWEAPSYRTATYARVRNISLTYRVPQSWLAKVHASSMSVYLNAVNPFLFHNSSIYDPETSQYSERFVTSTNQVGPSSYNFRSFVIGVRLGL